MSMNNDIVWGEKKETQKGVNIIHRQLRIMLADSLAVVGHSWDLGDKKKWYGTHSDKPDGAWDETAEKRMLNFARTSHSIFRASSALERGELRSKGSKKSIHFNDSEENIELLLRTDRAAADLCRELSKDSRALEKPDAYEYLETMEIPTEPPMADPHTDRKRQGNLAQDSERKFEQLSDDQKVSKTVL